MTKETYQKKQVQSDMSSPALDIVSNNTLCLLAWCGKWLRCRDNHRFKSICKVSLPLFQYSLSGRVLLLPVMPMSLQLAFCTLFCFAFILALRFVFLLITMSLLIMTSQLAVRRGWHCSLTRMGYNFVTTVKGNAERPEWWFMELGGWTKLCRFVSRFQTGKKKQPERSMYVCGGNRGLLQNAINACT